MTTYEAIIGMEVHIELQSKSKMFCGCSADFFGAPPNTHTCPVCLSMPGSLPVINEQAVAYTVMTGLALGSQIHSHNVFARKNYFYPDLPKGYQISQYELPLCTGGHIDLDVKGSQKRVRITRVHLEEDTGKLTHVAGGSLVDLNRAGVPLMEVVSEADIRSADEACAYVSKLRQIVRYLGVSSGDMEKGAMRCEVNLSLKPVDSEKWGTKVEVKNLNSFKAVRGAIACEIKRQTDVLESGGQVEQVTMGWDENKGKTALQRSKEEAHDYRYFPEPDLPPLNLKQSEIAELQAGLPELPAAKIARYIDEWALSLQNAELLAESRDRAEYFEAVVAAEKTSPTSAANWIIGEAFRLLNESGIAVADIKVSPADFARLIELVETNVINRLSGKEVLAEMWVRGQKPDAIVEARGLKQISDTGAIEEIVAQIIGDNPGPVAEFRAGKEKVIKFLVGQVMRQTRGKANPKVAEQIFRDKLQG
ncbi:MAG TPA: Asp-tRNA(Asn)/Glu-tRNA(Gln) amidotransferase subunit GatB [Chloroflexi bacterium]|nr:Asp-tRNA(Asn)/Glu-tRNA(Gln) amidotransferase subunit GatB [Chloroflexota bacterium]